MRASSSHQSKTASSIPKIYPPVASKSLETPPENPENTGSPTAPSAIYTPTTASVCRAPTKNSEKYSTSVCNVTGRASGTQTLAETHRSAHRSADFVSDLILFFVT